MPAAAGGAPGAGAQPTLPEGHGESPDVRSVVLPLVLIMVAVAVPFGLAVLAGAGGGIAVAAVGIVAIAACLAILTVALVRLMGDVE